MLRNTRSISIANASFRAISREFKTWPISLSPHTKPQYQLFSLTSEWNLLVQQENGNNFSHIFRIFTKLWEPTEVSLPTQNFHVVATCYTYEWFGTKPALRKILAKWMRNKAWIYSLICYWKAPSPHHIYHYNTNARVPQGNALVIHNYPTRATPR
mgnify:CR=1 FL=1